MRIDFRMEGGFAALPGLATPLTIECDSLPPDKQAQWRALLQRANFFARPEDAKSPPQPDARTYTILVDDGANCRSITVHEPIGDPGLRRLVEALRERAAAARARR
ncbi:MAG TPA: protealysin inhibitor emfourin [Casimicrobiaceae bacterium]|nr:protealysin inhibitor emfourin [Casimicrobiaceae bacterium]